MENSYAAAVAQPLTTLPSVSYPEYNSVNCVKWPVLILVSKHLLRLKDTSLSLLISSQVDTIFLCSLCPALSPPGHMNVQHKSLYRSPGVPSHPALGGQQGLQSMRWDQRKKPFLTGCYSRLRAEEAGRTVHLPVFTCKRLCCKL